MILCEGRSITSKIAVVGTQGTGKTELCHRIEGILFDQEISFCRITEVTEHCPHTLNENATSATQDWLWHEQMRQELVAQNTGVDVIICDRALIDHLVYLKRIVDKKHNLYQKHLEDSFKMLQSITHEWMTSYDYVVRLPLNLDRLKSGNNPLRSKDVAFAKEIDSIFDELLEPYAVLTEGELIGCITSSSR